MKQIRLAVLLLTVCGLLIPVSASGQAKLQVTGQQARSEEVQLSTEELSWSVQVRDICTTQVKKEQVRLPCSEWRPLLPTDGERTPFFKGEVKLADGKVQKLLGRRGPSSSGEQHKMSVLLRPPAPPEVPRLGLRHDSETDGLWKADTAALGGVLIRMLAAPEEAWTLSLKGKVQTTPLRWRAREKDRDYPLPAEQITAHRDSWRCRALDAWTTGEGLLTQTSWAVDGGALPLGHLTAQIDELSEFCPEPTTEAHRQVCELSAVTSSEIEADHEAADFERAQLLHGFCPGQGGEAIAESLKKETDRLVEELQVVALRSFASRWEPILGTQWKSDALGRLNSAVEAGFAALEQSEVVQGISLFINQHSEALGPEWTTRVEGRRTAVVESLLDRAATARNVGAITGVIEDHKAVMSQEWAASSTERRTGVISSYLDEAVAGKEVPKITEVIEMNRELVDATWLTDAQGQRTAVVSGLLKDALASKEVPQITGVIETHAKVMTEEWKTESEARRTAVVDGFLKQAIKSNNVEQVTGVIVTYEELLGAEWTTAASAKRIGLVDSFLGAALKKKDVSKATGLIDAHSTVLGAEWSEAAGKQRGIVIDGFLARAAKKSDIDGVQDLIEKYEALMPADWGLKAKEQRNDFIQAALDARIVAADIDGLEPILASYGKHMGTVWVDTAKGLRWSLASAKMDAVSEKGDIKGSAKQIQAWSSWMTEDQVTAARAALEFQAGEHFDGLLSKEKVEQAKEFVESHAELIGDDWRSRMGKRWQTFRESLAAAPAWRVTFSDDFDKCTIKVVRPVEPPRILLTHSWASTCSKISSFSTHEDQILLRTEKVLALLSVGTGKLKKLPRLSKLVSAKFNAKGEVLAEVTLSTEVHTNESFTKSWIAWGSRTYKLWDYFDVEMCYASLNGTYKLSGSRWKSVKTEVIQECNEGC